METKKCTECDTHRPLEEFSFSSIKRNLRHAKCKECVRDRGSTSRLIAGQFKWDYLISCGGCVDCGETDPLVLDFDHVDMSDKGHNVCDLVRQGYPISKIQEEIDKCVVKCANCHRRHTAEQLGWHRGIDKG